LAAPKPVERLNGKLAQRLCASLNANNESKSNFNNTEGDPLEFVAYTPGKRQQLTRRPKEVKSGRRTKRSVTPPKDRSLVPIKREPQLSRSPSPILPELPVALVGHALLYINYCMLLLYSCCTSLYFLNSKQLTVIQDFHSIAAGSYTLPCLLFNPAKRDWFPKMMEDEVWRSIILSLSAHALASVTGSASNYVDYHTLLDEALRQLKSRVASGSLPTDQTLGAISCLSMWSVSNWLPSFFLFFLPYVQQL
jgi:hypothetical protein